MRPKDIVVSSPQICTFASSFGMAIRDIFGVQEGTSRAAAVFIDNALDRAAQSGDPQASIGILRVIEDALGAGYYRFEVRRRLRALQERIQVHEEDE